MTDIQTIKAKIDADGITGEDESVVEILNETNLIGKKPINPSEIKIYLFVKGLWIEIKNSPSSAAQTAVEGLNFFEEFDIRIPEYESALITVLDDLVNEVLIPSFTAEHKTGILALGNLMESWAIQTIGRSVVIDDVIKARSLGS